MLDTLLQGNAVETLDTLIKLFMVLVGLATTLLSTFATVRLPPKWKAQTDAFIAQKEAELRQGLHMAARTGVSDGAKLGLTGAALVKHALRHMVTSTPEIIVELTPTPKEVINTAMPNLTLDRLPKPVYDVLERIVRSYTDD